MKKYYLVWSENIAKSLIPNASSHSLDSTYDQEDEEVNYHIVGAADHENRECVVERDIPFNLYCSFRFTNMIF